MHPWDARVLGLILVNTLAEVLNPRPHH